ncbi:hypothetical protein R3W88_006446 [Solanum pinnatisectum]|uniref:Uncharacterized protein n=1 Tax=Solanum pinnatisectum TaxID=50273 RepID=A0AAV9KFQ5_9SOLN|nr:hypothetical protein R3W88_006446 [Solanum pinnatisectum]
MGSLCKEGGAKEVQVEIINVEEETEKKLEKSSGEIPPLDVKDYEDLGLIIDLEKLGETNYESAGIDFNAMFSDFLPEDEEKGMEEKLMEIPPPDEGSSLATKANWDFELMEWIWSPYTYEEYLRYYKKK